MSIFATKYIIDDNGNPILLKHLNKIRINRNGTFYHPGKWNKTGKKARIKKRTHKKDAFGTDLPKWVF